MHCMCVAMFLYETYKTRVLGVLYVRHSKSHTKHKCQESVETKKTQRRINQKQGNKKILESVNKNSEPATMELCSVSVSKTQKNIIMVITMLNG